MPCEMTPWNYNGENDAYITIFQHKNFKLLLKNITSMLKIEINNNLRQFYLIFFVIIIDHVPFSRERNLTPFTQTNL